MNDLKKTKGDIIKRTNSANFFFSPENPGSNKEITCVLNIIRIAIKNGDTLISRVEIPRNELYSSSFFFSVCQVEYSLLITPRKVSNPKKIKRYSGKIITALKTSAFSETPNLDATSRFLNISINLSNELIKRIKDTVFNPFFNCVASDHKLLYSNNLKILKTSALQKIPDIQQYLLTNILAKCQAQ